MSEHIQNPVSRRDFLLKLAAVGAVVPTAAVLSACGGGGGQAAAGCTDISGLSPADAQTRVTFGYVEATPDAAKRCDNCALWVPAAAGAACGGCSLVKGPINPAGYCNSWAAKPA